MSGCPVAPGLGHTVRNPLLQYDCKFPQVLVKGREVINFISKDTMQAFLKDPSTSAKGLRPQPEGVQVRARVCITGGPLGGEKLYRLPL